MQQRSFVPMISRTQGQWNALILIIHIHFGSGHLGILYEKVRYSLRLEKDGDLVMWVHDDMENTVENLQDRGEL